MKKTILTLAVALIATTLFAQNVKTDTSKKEYKNVIAFNTTGLIGQFLNFSNYTFTENYSYMFVYKRMIKNSALRIGIGGALNTDQATKNDSLDQSNNFSSIKMGLGWEHSQLLAKKWSFYYGFDAVFLYSEDKSFYEYSSNHSVKNESANTSIGVSPLLGLTFHLNDRLSLSTETSFDFNYCIKKQEQIYSNSTVQITDTRDGTGFETYFHSPLSLLLRIRF